MKLHNFSRKLEKLWFSDMLFVIRPPFEMVKEGRILYNPKDHTSLNPVASGTFSGDSE
jgi:hypothetical protein